ncbi:MAG: DUF4129 domain-containing protein [Thermoplasmata archaeon]|nr:DUF4129 domain-containing protein [Thermoplasmata archaeon]
MTRPLRPSGVSVWLGALLLTAIAIGGAAALLTAPSLPAPPSIVGPTSSVTAGVAGWIVIGFVVLWLIFHLLERRRSGTLSMTSRPVVVFLVVFILAVSFVVIVRTFEPQPAAGNGQLRQGGPGTPGAVPNPPNSTNTTNGTPGWAPLPILGTSIPGWVVFAGLLLVGAVLAFGFVPLYLASRSAGKFRPTSDPKAVRRDFSDALRGLEDPGNPDVRAVIIALYARLLQRIGSSIGDTEVLTPREIEGASIGRLRIQPATARALTALFEEARYSSHTLDPSVGVRARHVFRDALAEMDSTARGAL